MRTVEVCKNETISTTTQEGSEMSEAPKAAPSRKKALSAEHEALVPTVKEMRDAGTTWANIGKALGLPGAATGAAFARKIYAFGFGEVPRSQVRDGSRKNREKNEEVKALKKTKKAERVAQVRSGEAVLRQDMTDEEVIATLRGRVIGWYINLDTVDGKGDNYTEQECGVHRRFCKVETHGGERCVVFKEYDPTANIKYREQAGSTRIVRLANIHTVR